jgi:hypothetical protein
MSLKTDYLDGASGLTQQMIGVFDEGKNYVTNLLSTLQAELQSAASKGQTQFTITLGVAFEPENLKLKGRHWESFKAGVYAQLAIEEIFDYEVEVALNESDQINLQLDLKFNFAAL